MVRWFPSRRCSPIGVDVGARSVKLVQFDADCRRVVAAARWDLAPEEMQKLSTDEQRSQMSQAIRNARDGRGFRGQDALICLSQRDLFLQNVRLPKSEGVSLERLVQQEAAGRVPFAVEEAEIRYIEAADIRHGDAVMREVILLACHRPLLDSALAIVEEAGLRPIAVEIEPLAVLRNYLRQSRREDDQQQRTMFVHVGYSRTLVVIAQGDEVLFIKYIEIGGRQLDEAVGRHLEMNLQDAAALRRHNGDRRADRQDPDVARGVAAAIRPTTEKLASELAMCVRYHSVTFRGQPLVRLILGGGEASPALLESLTGRLNLKSELSEPFRGLSPAPAAGHAGQWDVAAGLALRENES